MNQVDPARLKRIMTGRHHSPSQASFRTAVVFGVEISILSSNLQRPFRTGHRCSVIRDGFLAAKALKNSQKAFLTPWNSTAAAAAMRNPA